MEYGVGHRSSCVKNAGLIINVRHYLYEMQQRKYQKQIEHAGRKVLGEKLQALKNMTDGSLAYQQKELVAQMQKKKAQEATTEKEHQALKQMAKRLMSNFGEMKDLVPTVKHFRATRDAA
ncbi:unnamed protein product [Effrenium voratum]|nr:unnamed protein product [Effrenium voratum]